MKRLSTLILFLLLSLSTSPAAGQEVSFDVVASQKKADFSIAGIPKVGITPASTAVRIEWETDVPASSTIEYGETPAYGLHIPDSMVSVVLSKNHRVEIANLTAFRTYHFRIRSSGEGSMHEVFSRPLTFTTLPSGDFSKSPLSPTPLDFSAPRIHSFSFEQKDGRAEVDIVTDELSSTRFEYGVYVKGAPFLFEEKESSTSRTDHARLTLLTVTPGSMYLYRLTTQDRFGNRALMYGTLQTTTAELKSAAVKKDQKQSSVQKTEVPANSVLITKPAQLSGIPAADIWKDEKSGRLYRMFHEMPPDAALLLNPSELKGLTVFRIWKDEKTGRLYRHAGMPNPESKEKDKSKELSKNKETSKNKEEAKSKNIRGVTIPRQWIRITHPLQLKVLFKNEVWRDAGTGALYRIVK